MASLCHNELNDDGFNKPTLVWRLSWQKQVSQAGISNCIPQHSVRCNYLSIPEIPASGGRALIYEYQIGMKHTDHPDIYCLTESTKREPSRRDQKCRCHGVARVSVWGIWAFISTYPPIPFLVDLNFIISYWKLNIYHNTEPYMYELLWQLPPKEKIMRRD